MAKDIFVHVNFFYITLYFYKVCLLSLSLFKSGKKLSKLHLSGDPYLIGDHPFIIQPSLTGQ